MFGCNALRVKLDPVHWVLAMTNTHDGPIIGFGGDRQDIGKAGPINNKGVIPRRTKHRWQTFEHARTVVPDLAHLAMHGRARTHHVSSINLPDCLVAQAHPKDRQGGAEAGNQLQADACPVRVTRSG